MTLLSPIEYRGSASKPGGVAPKTRTWEKHFLWLAGVALFLLAWKLLSLQLGRFRLPAPEVVLAMFLPALMFNRTVELQGGGSDGIWPHLLFTVVKVVIGGGVGIPLGVLIGFLVSIFRDFRNFTEVLIEILRVTPPLVIIPFVVMWFGPRLMAQVGLIIFYCCLMMIITTVTAIKNLDPIYEKFARTLGASSSQIPFRVVLPAIVPAVTGGIRVTIGVVWGIAIVSELVGAERGMGVVFMMAMSFQALSLIIVGIIWTTIVAVLLDLLFVRLSRRLTQWANTQK